MIFVYHMAKLTHADPYFQSTLTDKLSQISDQSKMLEMKDLNIQFQ